MKRENNKRVNGKKKKGKRWRKKREEKWGYNDNKQERYAWKAKKRVKGG